MANSVRHKRILSVLFVNGLQMVQDNRIILTPAAMKAAWSALRGCLMLSHGQLDFVGITQGACTSVPYFQPGFR